MTKIECCLCILIKKATLLGGKQMKKITLYHGGPNKVIEPKYGFGNDKHDYGNGFYLTIN